MMRKIAAFILAAAVVLMVPASAVELNVNSQIEESDYQLMSASGLPREIVDAMDPQYRDQLLNALKEDPSKVYTTVSVMEVDNLREIESFMSSTEEELLALGANEVAISQTREKLDTYANQSVAELSKTLNITETEAKLVKSAIKNGLDAKVEVSRKENESVFASGSITSSEMAFSVTTVDYSNSIKAVQYNANCTYVWAEPYSIDIFTDKIGVAWGGELFESAIDGSAVYYGYNITGDEWTTDVLNGYAMEVVEESPNHHFATEFDQSVGYYQTKRGSLNFILSANNRAGENTYLIARYGHRIISATSPSITWGFPSISFNTAYDQTALTAGRVAITY